MTKYDVKPIETRTNRNKMHLIRRKGDKTILIMA